MISVHGLAKRFGSRVAVHPFDLEIPRGRVFGLLGHNGAGKSTTIGMLLGQVFPDAGRALKTLDTALKSANKNPLFVFMMRVSMTTVCIAFCSFDNEDYAACLHPR